MTQKERSFLVILSAAKNLEFLVGEAGGAVGKVDDAAVGEARLYYAVLHYVVVGVGVHAEVLAVLPGPGEAGLGDAVAVAGAGQAVDGGVGEGVLQPSSLVNAVVCGLDAGDEGEGANGGAAFVFDYEASAKTDIFKHHVAGGVFACPLGGVAVGAHYLARLTEKLHQPRHVPLLRIAHCHPVSLHLL